MYFWRIDRRCIGTSLRRRFTAEIKPSSGTTGRPVMDSKQLSTYQSLFLPPTVGNLFVFYRLSPHIQSFVAAPPSGAQQKLDLDDHSNPKNLVSSELN